MPSRWRRLVVLRHGETTHNAEGVWQGPLDSPLSAHGLEQARAAAPLLAALGPARVVSSDLQRASETARAVAEACGLPYATDARLREIHAGAWQGLTGAQVAAGYPDDMERLHRGEDFRRGVHGESVADVAARAGLGAQAFIGRLAAGECGVLVTHGVSGRCVVAEVTGIPQDLAWRTLTTLGNCHWALLSEAALGWRIDEWNASAREVGDVPTDLA